MPDTIHLCQAFFSQITQGLIVKLTNEIAEVIKSKTQ